VTVRLLLFLILFLAAGCTPFQQKNWSPGQPGLRVIEAVPFRPQEQRDDCGPSALASVLAHRGREVPVAAIALAVYEPKLGGSLLPDMENFARQQGFATRSGRGDLDLLRQEVAAGRPVVIPLETGFWRLSRPHYVVIFGYDQRRFLAHAGVREGVFIDADELLLRWEKMNRLYLYLE
jgi:ABC-type bacteriocin/lantibiotic exporter with double-glycine peptidase domain